MPEPTRIREDYSVGEVLVWIGQAKVVIERLSQDNARLRQALEPFVRHARAASLAAALEHISREDLLYAICALDARDGDHGAACEAASP